LNLVDTSAVNDPVLRLRTLLLSWGAENASAYPWRYSQDPYTVLVSEFMLHRTQTRQVVPIFARFITAFPTLSDYAHAVRDEVEEILKPLGLHWRIAGMLKALDTLWQQYGEVPCDYEKLIAIQGIGQYIAGATVCFTQNISLTLVDSNIVRVIGRIHNLDLSGEARRRRTVVDAVARACDPVHPRDYYYALIDLAHQICRPKNPGCRNCPLMAVPCQVGEKFNDG
jgi:A/G-specific adenine glycosylase